MDLISLIAKEKYAINNYYLIIKLNLSIVWFLFALDWVYKNFISIKITFNEIIW